ncbi:MAG: helix-turn-helix domain-containing protein, partial [Lachnospiraceae bacterium]|nr:helix-turn-helix domain-containing protein [Lachnospiraceae bacterium]
MVYQDVTRSGNISLAAKGLYAYLASFCGQEDECYPGVEIIMKENGIGKDTFYRHINSLVAAGVVEKAQIKGEGGKFGRTVYKLSHEVTVSEKTESGKRDFPYPQNQYTVAPDTAVKETNNNNIKTISDSNNNNKNNAHS